MTRRNQGKEARITGLLAFGNAAAVIDGLTRGRKSRRSTRLNFSNTPSPIFIRFLANFGQIVRWSPPFVGALL